MMIGHVIGLIDNMNQDSVETGASLYDDIIIPRFTRYVTMMYNVIIILIVL